MPQSQTPRGDKGDYQSLGGDSTGKTDETRINPRSRLGITKTPGSYEQGDTDREQTTTPTKSFTSAVDDQLSGTTKTRAQRWYCPKPDA